MFKNFNEFFVDQADTQNITHEYEIRFGNIKKIKDTQVFDTDNGLENFYKIKKALKDQKFTEKKIITQEHFFKYKNKNIKKITNTEDNSVSYISKINLNKYNNYDFDIRYSISSEEILYDVELSSSTPIILTRNKERYSFKILTSSSIDLTIVNEIKNNINTTKYEIEIDFHKNDKLNIEKIIITLLKIIQNSFYIISNKEKYAILYEYRTLTNSKNFVGVQPESLSKDKISKLYKNYSVTDKADGERFLLLISKSQYCYLIDNNLKNVIKTDIKSKDVSTILDGELVVYNNKFEFLTFDILVNKKDDIRGKNILLPERLKLAHNIVLNSTYTSKYILSMKKFYYENVFIGGKLLLDTIDNKPYKNDGLIFTPIDQPYPLTKKWSDLLKWKPSELNTIDFYCIKNENSNIFNLYVMTDNIEKDKDNIVLFDVKKLCGINTDYNNAITFNTEILPNVIDPTTLENYKTKTVIEFKWDASINKFVPLRTRWDKTANKNKKGNFYKVACDIWNIIHNPIDKDFLLSFNTNKNDFFFESMKKFHNYIKDDMYNKYTHNCEYLLDLCCGNGNDIQKYNNNFIKKIVGYDISEKCISQCNEKSKSKQNYIFYKTDLTLEDSYSTIYSHNKHTSDITICNFGIQYFFKSENSLNNLINILDYNLKNDGIFIISFLDYKNLSKLEITTSNTISNIIYEECDNELLYYIKYDKQNSNFDRKIEVVLNGNISQTLLLQEYIVDSDIVIQKFQDSNYTLIDSYNFGDKYNDHYTLKNYEKTISFLNKVLVFKKNPRIHINENIVKSNNLELFLKSHTEFSSYKISNYNDILNILNCIEFKYSLYDNDNNLDINNLNDIELVLNNTEYKCKLINNIRDKTQYTNNENILYIYYNKHIVEKQENKVQITKEYDNWYIILYENNILYKSTNILI